MIASMYGQAEIASLLIENKAEVNAKAEVRYDVCDKNQSIEKSNFEIEHGVFKEYVYNKVLFVIDWWDVNLFGSLLFRTGWVDGIDDSI